jgi:hypothetical protein
LTDATQAAPDDCERDASVEARRRDRQPEQKLPHRQQPVHVVGVLREHALLDRRRAILDAL